MKADIHPKYNEINVICGCGNKFTTHSTIDRTELKLDVCSNCHPFFTGKHKIVDTAGKVEKFMSRYGNYQSSVSDADTKSE